MRTLIRVLIVAGVVVGFTASAAAQQPTHAPVKLKYVNAERIVSIDGYDNFQQYCASCHGRDAKGTGPAARALEVPPANLTLIIVRNGGDFPSAHVRETIRGNHEGALVGMPEWAPVLRSVSVDDREAMLRLINLVKHVESVQQR